MFMNNSEQILGVFLVLLFNYASCSETHNLKEETVGKQFEEVSTTSLYHRIIDPVNLLFGSNWECYFSVRCSGEDEDIQS